MPTYHFRCETCSSEFSESLPMGTIDMPVCGTCQKNTAVRKMIRAPMVHFKGSGFYKTDSKGAVKQSPKETKPIETVEAKPAEKKPDTPKPDTPKKSDSVPKKE